MANVMLSLVATMSQQVKADFVRKTNQATAVQERFLRSLLQAHQNTEVGRHYRLAEPEIRTMLERQWSARPKWAAAMRHILTVRSV